MKHVFSVARFYAIQISIVSLLLLAAQISHAQVKNYFIHVDPSVSYLLGGGGLGSRFDLNTIYSDPQLNIKPGDMILIQARGSFIYGGSINGPLVAQSLLGVFVDGKNQFLFPGPKSTVSSLVSLPYVDYGVYPRPALSLRIYLKISLLTLALQKVFRFLLMREQLFLVSTTPILQIILRIHHLVLIS